ncbi:YtxH domain-containing protein [Streptomyces abikoensis]
MRYRLTFMVGAAVGYVLGARAGRERYEQLRKGARRVAQNPAVRNTVESAAQNGRAMASRALSGAGERMPESVAERVRSLRERGRDAEDDWGSSNT